MALGVMLAACGAALSVRGFWSQQAQWVQIGVPQLLGGLLILLVRWLILMEASRHGSDRARTAVRAHEGPVRQPGLSVERLKGDLELHAPDCSEVRADTAHPLVLLTDLRQQWDQLAAKIDI